MSEYQAGVIVDGRYRVISRIGAGGMADVYLAEDLQLSREVALKMLHRRFAEDPGFVERFRREAQSAAALQHPNVVSVFDRGSFDGTYYIAMEYLDGRTLKELIRQEAPLAPERAIEITIQILKAARFAHRRGVIHRDLKPHNVIIDSTDHVKVTDFGIARAGASDMTETGSIMGTAQYLSPEQAQGYPVSAPSDLYSVAIVLYEMITGRVPFDGDSAVSIALKQVSEAPVPPSQLNPSVPEPLEQVVLWALNKDPADRPADADEFITALEQAREVLTAPPGEVTATMRAVGPVVGAAGVAAGSELVPPAPATALLPAAAAYGSSQNLEAARGNSNGDGPEDDDDGRNWWPWVIALLVLLVIAGGVTAYLLTRPHKVVVPDVVQMTLPVAQSKLEGDGLNVNPIYEFNHASRNTVVRQSVDGGAKVKSGSTITLTVSNGPGAVNVPTVAAMPQKKALQAIKHAGLKVTNIVNESSNNINKGDAINTSPAAGTSLQRGKGVTLYVSTGLKIPNVTGDTVSEAQSALSSFDVHVEHQTASGEQPGTVFYQTPSAQTSAAAGSTVTIYVAKKPVSTTTSVPDVIGFTQAAAQNTLESKDLHPAYHNEIVKDPGKVGDVVRQSPNGDATVQKGATVNLWIGKLAPKARQVNTNTTTTPTTPTTTTTSTGSKASSKTNASGG